ncbi:MAG: hypothetical protein CMO74_14325 [Verrucomicrobiales bacterium]|nr:hypothetical protein [Verrucomicrobiales bacterium]|tara:strand:+ start:87476 stop:88291 length:816 start_codon:yes stop_codon:yes gene_type:complete
MVNNQSWEVNFLKDLLIRFKRLERSLSIIVQGPLHKRMNESIPHYLKLIKDTKYKEYGNLVISHWSDDDTGIIKDFVEDPLVHIEQNDYNNLSRYKNNNSKRGPNPWAYQNHTTHNGLKRATGYLSIKTRSDEIFPALDVFYRKLISADFIGKFLTSDIYFRRDSAEKFHPSDHIIGGRTRNLKDGFKLAELLSTTSERCRFRFPEQLICHALLKAVNVEPKEYKSKKIMKENFDVLPIAKMPGSIWTASYRKYRRLTTKEDGWVQDIKNL